MLCHKSILSHVNRYVSPSDFARVKWKTKYSFDYCSRMYNRQ